jgi:hypothetical protein
MAVAAALPSNILEKPCFLCVSKSSMTIAVTKAVSAIIIDFPSSVKDDCRTQSKAHPQISHILVALEREIFI